MKDMIPYRTFRDQFVWAESALRRLLDEVLSLPGVKVSVKPWGDSLGPGWRVTWSVPGVPAQREASRILPAPEWEKIKNWIKSVK